MNLNILLCLVLLCTLTYAQTGAAFLAKFVTNYNAKNYLACYRMLSESSQKTVPRANVTKALTGMMQAYGKVGFQQYYGPIQETKGSGQVKVQLGVLGFTNTAALSYFVWYERGNSVLMYSLVSEAKSIVSLISKYLSNSSTTILLDGKQQVNINGDVQRPLDALLVFPVAVEYANQVLQGKIKASTKIYSKDVINYYLPKFDPTLDYWGEPKESYSFKDIITVLSLAPSPALAEYIVDFLGIENVKATAQAFGFNASAFLYPASYRVAFCNPMNMSMDDYASYLQNYNISQLTADVMAIHDQLKAGNLTSITSEPEMYLGSQDVASYVNLWQPTASTSVIANAIYKFSQGNFKLASGVSNTKLIQLVGQTISPNWYQRQAPSALKKLYSYAAEFTSKSLPSTMGGFFSGMVYIEFPAKSANKNIILVLSVSGVNQDVADQVEEASGIAYPMIGLNPTYRAAVVKRLQALKQ